MPSDGMTNQLDYARMAAWIQSIIDALFANAADEYAASTEQLEFATARAEHMFAQALHDNSNFELDWLWYAAHIIDATERRYCLKRALAINPHSSLARSALAKLPRQNMVAGDIAPLSRAVGSSGSRP
jgi:hypothetical protein